MPKAPYRIIFYENDQCTTWEFDDTAFETAEAAYDVALENYGWQAFRIVKLCYPSSGNDY